MWFGVVVVVAAQVAAPAPPPAAVARNVEAVRALAKKAVDEGRFCDASFYDAGGFALNGKASALYNAAENAFAAGDLVRALNLYQDVQKRDVDKKIRPAQVSARIAEIVKMLKSTGPGPHCLRPKAVCGNAFVEEGESCDDPTASSSVCPATCVLPVETPAITSPVDEAPLPLPLILSASGGAAVAAGVVVVVVGLQPFFAFQSVDAQLLEAERKLADPGDLPRQQQQARDDYASYGSPLVIAGSLAVGVGVVVAVGGLLLLVE